MGMTPKTAAQWALIAKLNAEGKTDTEIARLVGLNRCYVQRVRSRRLGLPVAAGVREAQRRVGLGQGVRGRGWAKILAGRQGRRREAAASGWPQGLLLTETRILDALALHGPMTRKEIADAIGLPWTNSINVFHAGNAPGGNYLRHLVKTGLVVRLCPIAGVVRGVVWVFSLSFDALDYRNKEAADART